jgi:flagellar protein FliL
MAAPKPEANPTAKSEPAPAAPAGSAGAKLPGALKAWLPVVASLLLAPVATWAAVEFVLLPHLQKKIAAGAAPAAAAPSPGGKEGKEGKGGKEGPAALSYEFQNVIVNLAGTMGTRYLKTSFIVTGAKDSDIRNVFEAAKPRLTDVTLNVLSSLTLADLEEPGAKNVIREKLVGVYNQALGKKVADQVYFSDFVIQ